MANTSTVARDGGRPRPGAAAPHPPAPRRPGGLPAWVGPVPPDPARLAGHRRAPHLAGVPDRSMSFQKVGLRQLRGRTRRTSGWRTTGRSSATGSSGPRSGTPSCSRPSPWRDAAGRHPGRTAAQPARPADVVVRRGRRAGRLGDPAGHRGIIWSLAVRRQRRSSAGCSTCCRTGCRALRPGGWTGYNWLLAAARLHGPDHLRRLDVVPLHRGLGAGRAQGCRPSCTRRPGLTGPAVEHFLENNVSAAEAGLRRS